MRLGLADTWCCPQLILWNPLYCISHTDIMSNGIWYTIIVIVLYSVHITLQIRIGLLVNCVSACLDYQEMYMSDHV